VGFFCILLSIGAVVGIVLSVVIWAIGLLFGRRYHQKH
jgi:hypothetical protein